MIYVFQLGIGNLIGNTKPNSSITSTMSRVLYSGRVFAGGQIGRLPTTQIFATKREEILFE